MRFVSFDLYQTKGSHLIMSLMESLVFPTINSQIEAIKGLSLKCLALCSLNDDVLYFSLIIRFLGAKTLLCFWDAIAREENLPCFA